MGASRGAALLLRAKMGAFFHTCKVQKRFTPAFPALICPNPGLDHYIFVARSFSTSSPYKCFPARWIPGSCTHSLIPGTE